MVHPGPDPSNEPRRLRHLVWLHPDSGRLAMATWFNRPDGPEPRWPIRLVAEGTVHTRPIHVDGDQIFLSIPTDAAFGLADLPPGRSLAWNDCRRDYLTRNAYDTESLRAMIACLNEDLR